MRVGYADEMADHRRVEARGIIGTGMANDVDRLRDIEADQERKQRAWRSAPEKGFGEVLTDAPAKGELEDDSADDPRKKRAAPPASASSPSPSPSPLSPNPIVAAGAPAPLGKPELPKVAPDPRERMLREQLAKSLAKPKPRAVIDTPPTGSHRKP